MQVLEAENSALKQQLTGLAQQLPARDARSPPLPNPRTPTESRPTTTATDPSDPSHQALGPLSVFCRTAVRCRAMMQSYPPPPPAARKRAAQGQERARGTAFGGHRSKVNDRKTQLQCTD
eukprot:SAG11_NODE_104_length_16539_cov_8.526642_3_plen_120_part_00